MEQGMKPKRSKLAKSRADVASRYWRTNADAAWSIAVRKRAGNKCEICRTTAFLHAHHLVDRSLWQLRHDLQNGVALCANHHKYSRFCSPHKGGLAFYGLMWRHWPTRMSLLNMQVSEIQMGRAEMVKDYKAAYERLKGGE